MADVSGSTLVMAIQAVDAERRRLEQELETAPDDEQADLQELISCYGMAADDLKRVYLEVCRETINLPPYSQLIGDD